MRDIKGLIEGSGAGIKKKGGEDFIGGETNEKSMIERDV